MVIYKRDNGLTEAPAPPAIVPEAVAAEVAGSPPDEEAAGHLAA